MDPDTREPGVGKEISKHFSSGIGGGNSGKGGGENCKVETDAERGPAGEKEDKNVGELHVEGQCG